MPKWNLFYSEIFPDILQQLFLVRNPNPVEAEQLNHGPIIKNVNFSLL